MNSSTSTVPRFSTISTRLMSAPIPPNAEATAPKAPGRLGSRTRISSTIHPHTSSCRRRSPTVDHANHTAELLSDRNGCQSCRLYAMQETTGESQRHGCDETGPPSSSTRLSPS